MLLNSPPKGRASRFVITEERAYFYPIAKGKNGPGTIDILARIFDLEDPEVFKDVSERLLTGNVVRGHYAPSTGQVAIMGASKPSAYLQRRIEDVFGV
ncbi:MAG TPA: hypothetical protein VKA73_16400 [Rubrobacter sp.]|nr:hypothetical protein [Rubrobacter sp.]